MGKITIDICGGLGNQLFQIFAMIKVASDNNMVPVFPNIHKIINPNNTQRHTFWQIFPSLILENNFDRDVIHVNQPQFWYVPITVNPGLSYRFDGFYQSWKYFEGVNPSDYICLPISDQKRVNDIVADLRMCNRPLVSVHIRRGDYLRLQHFHNVLPEQYYRLAKDWLTSQGVIDPVYVIFSDDLAWCRQNLSFIAESDRKYVHETEYNELMVMAKCDHHIIANSSFSWWGAYLNTSPDKKVCYPFKWFEADLDTRDVCPPEWHRILF